MDRKYTNRRYLDALQERVLIFDGAMGTSLQTMNLTADDFGGEQYNGCNDFLVITAPDAVAAVHRSFSRWAWMCSKQIPFAPTA
jgi:5-methyltetrahydrofolate--homocysteine methyltransferase